VQKGKLGNSMDLKQFIRDIPDFPSDGIVFKDITPLLQSPSALGHAIDLLTSMNEGKGVEVVAAIEARGFIFGAPLAYKLGASFVPVRKQGKLPSKTIQAEYLLEYGAASLEIHEDAILPGKRVLVIDDLLATGGTMAAAIQLIERLGGQVVGVSFVIELSFLKGREKIGNFDPAALISY